MYIIKLIQLIHLIIIFLISISIFISNKQFKNKILLILLFILFHHITNYGRCGLTDLEYFITKKPYRRGFIYRILSPFMHINNIYLKKYIYILHIIYIFLLIYQINKY